MKVSTEDHYILSVEITAQSLEKLRNLADNLQADIGPKFGIQTSICDWPSGSKVRGTSRANELYKASLRGSGRDWKTLPRYMKEVVKLNKQYNWYTGVRLSGDKTKVILA